MVHNALRENNAEKLQFIKKNVKASPESAAQILHYIQDVNIPAAHHLLLKDHLFISPMKASPSADEKVFFVLDIYIQHGGQLISEDVGKTVYVTTHQGPWLDGVYLDSGDGKAEPPRYNSKVVSGMLLQLGLNPIGVRRNEKKRTDWYQKFLELNPR